VQLEDLVKIKGMSECLGKGVSGTVWKVRDKSVDETLALKEMAMDATDEAKNQTLVDEMQIMLELDHPSIVACHGVFYELGMFKIVMEFCDAGSLLDVMRLGDHKIPADALAGMMFQVLKAMAYLHKDKRVIHRDVKPGNILLNRQGQCKLADFGVCSKPRDTRDSMCATWVGTVTYMSPERIKGNSYSFNADVWALGVIVVEATLGRYVCARLGPLTLPLLCRAHVKTHSFVLLKLSLQFDTLRVHQHVLIQFYLSGFLSLSSSWVLRSFCHVPPSYAGTHT